MIEKMKKASVIFWVISAVSLMLSIVGCLHVEYDRPGVIHEIGIIDYVMVIPCVLLSPFMEMGWEPYERAICYGLLMIPVIFFAIAIVLRMIAKALEEHTIAIMNLMNEDKKKSKEVI